MPIYKFTLKAGQNLPQVIGGEFIQYVDGPAPLRIRTNGGSWNEYWIGTGTGREAFDSFEVENPSGFEVTIYLWVDTVEFIDRRRNQIEAPTEFDPVEDVAGVYEAGALLAGQALDLSGNAPAGRIRRKAVQIFNLDPASNLLLCASAGALTVTLAGFALANGSYRYTASAARWDKVGGGFYIRNDAGRWKLYATAEGGDFVLYRQNADGGVTPAALPWEKPAGSPAALPAPTVTLVDRVGGIVRPGETITQPVSGPFRIKNETGAPIACWVSEINWTA